MSLKKSQMYMRKKEEPHNFSVEQVRRIIEKDWFSVTSTSLAQRRLAGWPPTHGQRRGRKVIPSALLLLRKLGGVSGEVENRICCVVEQRGKSQGSRKST